MKTIPKSPDVCPCNREMLPSNASNRWNDSLALVFSNLICENEKYTAEVNLKFSFPTDSKQNYFCGFGIILLPWRL